MGSWGREDTEGRDGRRGEERDPSAARGYGQDGQDRLAGGSFGFAQDKVSGVIEPILCQVVPFRVETFY